MSSPPLAIVPRLIWQPAPNLVFTEEDDDDDAREGKASIDPPAPIPHQCAVALYRLQDGRGYGLDRTWRHPVWAGLRAEEARRESLLAQLESLDEQVGEGTFECPGCGSRKTYSQGLQTRSADEPLTYYVRCARTECPRSLKIWVVGG